MLPSWPVYEEETVELSGFVHHLWWWNCPACGEWRVDFEHQEMGSGNSRRLRARLARFVDHWRFAVPFYLRRLFVTEQGVNPENPVIGRFRGLAQQSVAF